MVTPLAFTWTQWDDWSPRPLSSTIFIRALIPWASVLELHSNIRACGTFKQQMCCQGLLSQQSAEKFLRKLRVWSNWGPHACAVLFNFLLPDSFFVLVKNALAHDTDKKAFPALCAIFPTLARKGTPIHIDFWSTDIEHLLWIKSAFIEKKKSKTLLRPRCYIDSLLQDSSENPRLVLTIPSLFRSCCRQENTRKRFFPCAVCDIDCVTITENLEKSSW